MGKASGNREPSTGGYLNRIKSPSVREAGRPTTARRWWPALTTLLVVGVGVSLLVPGGRHQWALSIVRQPARFTALSFDHPNVLPTQVRENQPISVAFTIGNEEGRPLDYRYVINVSPAASAAQATTATAVVRAGGSRSISAVVRLRCANSPCRVQVSLPGHPESIDFLATLVPHTNDPHG